MAVEPQMQRRWEEQLAGYVRGKFPRAQLGNMASQAVQLVSKLVTAFILYFGAKMVIEGDLTVGELVAFNMLAGRVSSPVLRLAQIWQDFHQARLSVAALGDILNTPPEPTFNPARTALPAIKGEITFEHVTFRYRVDGPEMLHDISFTVAPGQVHRHRRPVRARARARSPSSCSGSMCRRAAASWSTASTSRMVDPSWLRRQSGWCCRRMSCSTARSATTSRWPIRRMPLELVVEAAKLAGAHDFILELPEGYDTIVGERGSSLSGGQRQRIAIARALVTKPRILIFDEATSALDYESERIIQQNMNAIVSGRTVLIIAHRLSTVRRADRIITIDRGRLTEDGTHEQLIASGGRYAALHRIQAGIHEVG